MTHESANGTASDTTSSSFAYYFKQLPVEVQAEVWRNCLPRRIISTENFRHNCNHFPGRHDMRLLCISKAPPAIRQVCREARFVAMNNGGGHRRIPSVVHWAHLSPLQRADRPWMRVWFDASCDVILLDDMQPVWDPVPAEDGDGPHPSLPDDHVVRFASGQTPVCIPQWRLHILQNWMRHPDERPRLRFLAPWVCSSPKRRIYVYIREIAIHMPLGNAQASGLFGTCAEEPMKLVQLRDVDTLQEFVNTLQLATDHDCTEKYKHDIEFIRSLLDEKKRHEIAENERNLIELAWFMKNGPGKIPTKTSRILWRHLSGKMSPKEKIKVKHSIDNSPWIQKARSPIPDVDLVVLFRLCPSITA